MVEESSLPFKLHQIDIHKGVQNNDAFEKLNPIGRFLHWLILRDLGESRRQRFSFHQQCPKFGPPELYSAGR
jgi:hypothetical protein